MNSPESEPNASVQPLSTQSAPPEAAPASAAATPSAAPAEPLNAAQMAYLLHFLAQAPEGSMRHGEIRKKVELIAANRVGLNPVVAMPGMDQMAADGLVESFNRRGTTCYRITERGRAYLQSLEAHRPAIRQTGGDYVPPADEGNIKREREVCLLLGLLEAESAIPSPAAKPTGSAPAPPIWS